MRHGKRRILYVSATAVQQDLMWVEVPPNGRVAKIEQMADGRIRIWYTKVQEET